MFIDYYANLGVSGKPTSIIRPPAMPHASTYLTSLVVSLSWSVEPQTPRE